VKRNVTVLSHLVLGDFHLGQKGWAQSILFLIILYVCKHQLVLANLGDHLKWEFTILETNTKKGMYH
jgi:hypothetical protein